MHVAYLSIGSNLGDREANLRAAIAALKDVGDVTRTSSFYETEPMELREQPWFLNCVVELKTELQPRELLTSILAIEQRLGRKRDLPKGPRIIDLDLLLFNGSTVHEPQTSGLGEAERSFEVPHPAMHRRRFVLEPLSEIAPAVRHPRLGKTASELLQELPAQAGIVRRLAP
ncbi:MAG: 2-amino-4-hydroxy-6-hydroxymethyldihydropteridine diphosphokinase [Acidobacteria bacterium]|nr:2-amino-4-hydroxy-6-hydroxymethyldihydropteridine diphosphokinase [Acidobacteriota bacterium]